MPVDSNNFLFVIRIFAVYHSDEKRTVLDSNQYSQLKTFIKNSARDHLEYRKGRMLSKSRTKGNPKDELHSKFNESLPYHIMHSNYKTTDNRINISLQETPVINVFVIQNYFEIIRAQMLEFRAT